MTESLGEALPKEIIRNEALLIDYGRIPTGGFAIAMIQADLKQAHEATARQDVIAMLQSYEKLAANK